MRLAGRCCVLVLALASTAQADPPVERATEAAAQSAADQQARLDEAVSRSRQAQTAFIELCEQAASSDDPVEQAVGHMALTDRLSKAPEWFGLGRVEGSFRAAEHWSAYVRLAEQADPPIPLFLPGPHDMGSDGDPQQQLELWRRRITGESSARRDLARLIDDHIGCTRLDDDQRWLQLDDHEHLQRCHAALERSTKWGAGTSWQRSHMRAIATGLADLGRYAEAAELLTQAIELPDSAPQDALDAAAVERWVLFEEAVAQARDPAAVRELAMLLGPEGGHVTTIEVAHEPGDGSHKRTLPTVEFALAHVDATVTRKGEQARTAAREVDEPWFLMNDQALHVVHSGHVRMAGPQTDPRRLDELHLYRAAAGRLPDTVLMHDARAAGAARVGLELRWPRVPHLWRLDRLREGPLGPLAVVWRRSFPDAARIGVLLGASIDLHDEVSGWAVLIGRRELEVTRVESREGLLGGTPVARMALPGRLSRRDWASVEIRVDQQGRGRVAVGGSTLEFALEGYDGGYTGLVAVDSGTVSLRGLQIDVAPSDARTAPER